MRRKQSRSLVFLTELFLALTIFALCASVCAGLFAWSHRLSEASGHLTNGVMAAQSGAEAFKVYDNAEAMAQALGGSADGDLCVVYFCRDWRPVGAEDAAFIMRIQQSQGTILRHAQILVSDADDGEIFRLDASALISAQAVTEAGR